MRPLLLLTFLASLAAKKMYIYVGQSTESDDPFKIYAFCDINEVETLIHSSDFLCIPENSCRTEPEIMTGIYQGLPYRYQYAWLQINLLIMPFEEPMRVHYALDRTNVQSSILGFSTNSTFFSYFVRQNYLHDLQINFYFDWESVVYFRSEVFSAPKLPVNTTLMANLTFYPQAHLPPQTLKFCLANQAPQDIEDAAFFRVPNATFPWWQQFLTTTKKASDDNIYGNILYNLTFQLYTPDFPDLGRLTYQVDDLVDDRFGLNVQPFSPGYDSGRGCDVYIGAQSLQKFNFKFYYSEDDSSHFFFNFGYDGMNGILSDQQNANSLLWLQMIFFVIVFSFISFLAYEYILKKNEDIGLRDEELSIPGDENEEKGYAEPKYNITRDEINLLERRIN